MAGWTCAAWWRAQCGTWETEQSTHGRDVGGGWNTRRLAGALQTGDAATRSRAASGSSCWCISTLGVEMVGWRVARGTHRLPNPQIQSAAVPQSAPGATAAVAGSCQLPPGEVPRPPAAKPGSGILQSPARSHPMHLVRGGQRSEDVGVRGERPAPPRPAKVHNFNQVHSLTPDAGSGRLWQEGTLPGIKCTLSRYWHPCIGRPWSDQAVLSFVICGIQIVRALGGPWWSAPTGP